MPNGYTLVDPFSKDLKYTQAGLDFAGYKKAYDGLLQRFLTEQKTTVFCVHRMKGIGRWFNVHPNNPGAEYVAMGLLDGHWRVGSPDEEKAHLKKVQAERKAEEKRRVSAFAQAANVQAASLIQENETLQNALAAEQQDEDVDDDGEPSKSAPMGSGKVSVAFKKEK